MSSQRRAGGGLPDTLGLASVLAEALSGWLDPPGNMSKVPPWHRNAKGFGKTGKGPSKEPPTNGKGKGYGKNGRRGARRAEWICTVCDTSNWLTNEACRMCTHPRAHGARVIPGDGQPSNDKIKDPPGQCGRRGGSTQAACAARGPAVQAATAKADADMQDGPDATTDKTAQAEPARFSARKLRRAAVLLEAAGIVDNDVINKVHVATTAAAGEAAAKSRSPVGARLDKARARLLALTARAGAAEKAVVAAKTTLRDIKDEARNTRELIKELEEEIAHGKASTIASTAERALRELQELLDAEGDQAAFAFKARLILKNVRTDDPGPEDGESGGSAVSADEGTVADDDGMSESAHTAGTGDEVAWRVMRRRGRASARSNPLEGAGKGHEGNARDRSPRR